MEVVVGAKDLLSCLTRVELSGKYAGASRRLSEAIIIGAEPQMLRMYNGDAATFVSCNIPSTEINENNGGYRWVLMIDDLKKYLRKMSGDITLDFGDALRVTQDNKVATIPFLVEHPHNDMIQASMGRIDGLAESMTWGEKLTFESHLTINSDVLKSAIDSCSAVGSHIYRFEIMDGNLTISSELSNESYREVVGEGVCVGEATTMISAPLHTFLKKNEEVILMFNDNSPIAVVTDSGTLLRAPRID
jgi:hypothetical protein